MAFRARPYQSNAVEQVQQRYHSGARSLLLYLPTGAGKTVIATLIIDKLLKSLEQFGRILFVAHREEILDQTAKTLKKHLRGISLSIEQGKRHADKSARITLASVQSLVKRKQRFDPHEFSLIICDECHRALSPSWGEVIDYFHKNSRADTLLLGMTATPRRSDGRSAAEVFKDVAFEITRTELQDLGYLVPMSYYTVQTQLGLDQLEMTAGDFKVTSLSKVMNHPSVRALTLRAWRERGDGKKTIAFCAGVEHAHAIADALCAMGVKAAAIDGKTQNRSELLSAFKKGELEVITNYGVLTEGFDDPTVACILMARPTTSPLVYNQCIGRGLRISEQKAACTVIDIVDRNNHQLQYAASESAGLPKHWRCKGRDPFREQRALQKIRVNSPEAFLRIQEAQCLEDVQTVLMSLPPAVVEAGLDGEAVLHYEAAAAATPPTDKEAATACRQLLKQAGARAREITVDANNVLISLHAAETNNERYDYLLWHLQRVSQRDVNYKAPRRRSKPRALLRSMVPPYCNLQNFKFDEKKQCVDVQVSNLAPQEMEQIVRDFESESGLALNISGQLSMFDELF